MDELSISYPNLDHTLGWREFERIADEVLEWLVCVPTWKGGKITLQRLDDME